MRDSEWGKLQDLFWYKKPITIEVECPDCGSFLQRHCTKIVTEDIVVHKHRCYECGYGELFFEGDGVERAIKDKET